MRANIPSLTSIVPLPARRRSFTEGTFVTGFPRSGTTFIGEALSKSWKVSYIHEPFSSVGIQGVDWGNLELDPHYLMPKDEKAASSINDVLKLRFRQPNNINPTEPILRRCLKLISGSRGPFYLVLAKLNRFSDHLLIKDPVGNKFAPHFQRNCGFGVVVVVKHPVSNWASYQRVGWPSYIHASLRSPEFAQFYDEEEIEYLSCSHSGLPAHIRFAIAWRLQYRFFISSITRGTKGQFVTIEEVSETPELIEAIARRLSIPWGVRNSRWLARNTRFEGKEDVIRNVVQDLQRDSSKIFSQRIASVDPAIRADIERITWPIGQTFYSESLFFT